MKGKKLFDYIGRDSKKITISINLKNTEESYIMECLELYCDENSISYSGCIKKMIKTFLEDRYGKQRTFNPVTEKYI
jgi:hypothetical protein